MEFKFKGLQASDLFLLTKVVSKIDLKSLPELIKSAGDNQQALGVMMIQTILGNLDKCEHEIYQLLAKGSDLSLPEISALDLGDFIDLVGAYVKQPGFSKAIERASALLKSE
ncbi:MAG: hypothetical protein FWF59_11960 [Turicibacter sp.]|nr:hypothetical protein [Turicibacter sp.]